ncbi:hypothetical protein KIN20_000505 [Parelaphostrongylus tenuis]|uniref:Uncharacterized protein n=1 Tax=Parelaphostrongylus tenuis TaxID=148309 RepID=A0AAD5MBG9_PARTN|nr:hypothetical protein KIN20_000505 [Parelaphostrongylus tenuis]
MSFSLKSFERSNMCFVTQRIQLLFLSSKRSLKGFLKIPVNDQILARLIDDNINNFQILDNKKTLAESGFNVNNAKAQSPAIVALMFKGETAPIIDELSTPPPSPGCDEERNSFSRMKR